MPVQMHYLIFQKKTTNEKGALAEKNMYCLRQAFYLAKKVGKGVGRS